MATNSIRPGIYNVEYFSGAQVALYIGDIWVDEITTMSFSVSQSRRPIYGYASQLFDDVAEGNVLVEGQFTINFKDAGYLWLVLNRYKELAGHPDAMYKKMIGETSMKSIGHLGSPFAEGDENKDYINRQNIEKVINGEVSVFERNRALAGIAEALGNATAEEFQKLKKLSLSGTSASLGGYASEARRAAERSDGGRVGRAESVFEEFENQVWKLPSGELDNQHRRCDDPYLNPFDIYLTFGDFAGSDYDNHTIQRLRDVYIVGASKQVVIDGQPIQEAYNFIARNII